MLGIVTGKLERQQSNQEGIRQCLGLAGLGDCDLKGLNGSRRPQEPEPALEMT